MLGPLRITGWSDDQARSGPVTELATYLALHPGRRYTTEELRDPLSIGKARALEASTIRTYANTLRRAVGTHLPDAGRLGYALTDAGTDWQRFTELAQPAADGTDLAEQARRLTDALALVRGAPFSDLPSTGFGWIATELSSPRSKLRSSPPPDVWLTSP